MKFYYEFLWSAGKILQYLRFYCDISITSVFGFIMLLNFLYLGIGEILHLCSIYIPTHCQAVVRIHGYVCLKQLAT